jgi:glycosyltransferase involved in cell wall biosynthesis
VRIGYFVRNAGMSGGVKVVLQHLRMLSELGHDAVFLARRVVDDWVTVPQRTVIVSDDLSNLPECDLYVATVASDVMALYGRTGTRLAHLCQSYEPEEYRARLRKESVTEKYRATGLFSFIKNFNNDRHFKRRIDRFKRTYGLPTIKVAVSKHLVETIEKEYGQKCFLVQNGVDGSVFHPDTTALPFPGPAGRVRVLCSGSIHVGCKGIPDALEAIRTLKERGRPIELTRVSSGPASEEERRSGIVDRFLTAISEAEMADLYRQTDVYVSASLEGEGFGLPAIEAMSSGVPCVLTDISTYRNFDANRDFACFAPVHRPDAIAAGIEALMTDSTLRGRCVERGFVVAQNFSLERTKRDLDACVKEIARM